jgi:ankyrin repeat protein
MKLRYVFLLPVIALLLWLNECRATVGSDLIDAARDGHMPEIIRWLKHHHVDVKDSNEYTAFMWASFSGHLDVMEHLLKNGANINTRDRVYHTPLILAARDGRLEVVKFLISKGAKLQYRDNSRMTALTWASVRGHHDIVHALVEAGSDIHHEDHIDRTALDWAKLHGHDSIHDHLVAKGATSAEHRQTEARQRVLDAEKARLKRVTDAKERAAKINL